MARKRVDSIPTKNATRDINNFRRLGRLQAIPPCEARLCSAAIGVYLGGYVKARVSASTKATTVISHHHRKSSHADLDGAVRGAICHNGPVLVRVVTDYGKRKIRWIEAVRKRYTKELTLAQKTRFLARIGSRAIRGEKESD
jgi:hypothetical protein